MCSVQVSVSTKHVWCPDVNIARTRKVKCDEEKPFCRKCTSGGRTCPGYSSPPPPKARIRRSKYEIDVDYLARTNTGICSNTESGAPACSLDSLPVTEPLSVVSRSLESIIDLNELRGLRFFHTHASMDISAYFEGEFWQCCLQAGHSEPVVRHALLAVSSLYEAQEFSQPATDHSYSLSRFALQQYTKAINLLSRTTGDTPHTPQVVLISCLIFIWLEFLQDNIDTALGHLKSGIRILSDQPRMSQCRDPGGFLFQIFTRLHTQAALHGSPSSDFDSNETFLTANEGLGDLRFARIREARSSLDGKLNGVFRFHRLIEQPGFIQKCQEDHSFPHLLEGMRQSHLDGLQTWKTAYDEMVQRLHLTTQGDDLCLQELELQYLLTTNMLMTLFATSPMVYDAYNAEFARAIYLVGQTLALRRPQRRLLAIPFDMGVLAPLFYVLLKCRDATIRREAMAILHECPEREGMWDRASLVEFAEWKISKEEQGRAGSGLSEQDPLPEDARIYCEKIRAVVVGGRAAAIVSYKRGAYGGIADIEPDEEEITNMSMRLAAILGT